MTKNIGLCTLSATLVDQVGDWNHSSSTLTFDQSLLQPDKALPSSLASLRVLCAMAAQNLTDARLYLMAEQVVSR